MHVSVGRPWLRLSRPRPSSPSSLGRGGLRGRGAESAHGDGERGVMGSPHISAPTPMGSIPTPTQRDPSQPHGIYPNPNPNPTSNRIHPNPSPSPNGIHPNLNWINPNRKPNPNGIQPQSQWAPPQPQRDLSNPMRSIPTPRDPPEPHGIHPNPTSNGIQPHFQWAPPQPQPQWDPTPTPWASPVPTAAPLSSLILAPTQARISNPMALARGGGTAFPTCGHTAAL